jgi:hypothetical protein
MSTVEWELYCNVLFKHWLRPVRVGVNRTYLVLASSQAFYSSRPDSYNETQGLTGGPEAGKTLCSRALMATSSKCCLQWRGHAWSCCLPTSRACTARRRVLGWPDTIAVHREWAAGQRYTVVSYCDWLADRCCPIVVLLTSSPHVLLAFNVPLAACLTCTQYQLCHVASWKIRSRPDER